MLKFMIFLNLIEKAPLHEENFWVYEKTYVFEITYIYVNAKVYNKAITIDDTLYGNTKF